MSLYYIHLLLKALITLLASFVSLLSIPTSVLNAPLKGRSKRAWVSSVVHHIYIQSQCLSQSRSSINYVSHYPLFLCSLQLPPVPNQVQGSSLKAPLFFWPGTPAGILYLQPKRLCHVLFCKKEIQVKNYPQLKMPMCDLWWCWDWRFLKRKCYLEMFSRALWLKVCSF